MSREVHVRFCERLEVKSLWPTHPLKLADRPCGRRLLDKVRAGDHVIVRWVDRLGRNYDDATATIRHLMAEGVIVRTVINAMTFDGSTSEPIQKAVRDALIGFMAATARG